MDTQQLKILAARLRQFLAKRGYELKHGHCLGSPIVSWNSEISRSEPMSCYEC